MYADGKLWHKNHRLRYLERFKQKKKKKKKKTCAVSCTSINQSNEFYLQYVVLNIVVVGNVDVSVSVAVAVAVDVDVALV